MRVALFTETFLPKVDGIVTVVCLLLDHLQRRGVETMIVAPRLPEAPNHYKETPVITVPGVTLPIYPELKTGPPTYGTYRAVKDFQPDIVHIIHPAVIGTPGLLMGKRLGVPSLASFHLDLAQMARHFKMPIMEPVINRFHRFAFNMADYSLAPSRAVQREMKALGVREVGLWGRGVDADKFNPNHRSAEMRHQLSDGDIDAPLLIYVGRLSAEKQIDQIKGVLDAIPEARLAIVGDGPARESLEAHFAGTRTKFMGYMTGAPLYQAYASADVFVFPSALETFGLVVTEAMAAGLPVVASRVGGIPDVVQIGKTGYTFDVSDVDAMIDGVRRVTSSRARIEEMGHSARAFAETQAWPVLMDEVITHYERLIDQKGRQRVQRAS